MDDSPKDYGAPVYLKKSQNNKCIPEDAVFVDIDEGDLPESRAARETPRSPRRAPRLGARRGDAKTRGGDGATAPRRAPRSSSIRPKEPSSLTAMPRGASAS